MLVLLLLLIAQPALSQSVRLELRDAVQGNVIVRDNPLPAGTLVWVAQKPETRAMRLRDGYSEVRAAMFNAQSDSLDANSRTFRSYASTSSIRQAYFVFARTPDGRFFQSYVTTSDEGKRPGFDKVEGGRILMGPIADSTARSILAIVQPPPPPSPPADTASIAPEQVLGQELHEAPPEAVEPDVAAEAPAPTSWTSLAGGVVFGGMVGWVLGWTFRSRRSVAEVEAATAKAEQARQTVRALEQDLEETRAALEDQLEEERFRYASLLSQTRMLQELNTEQAEALEKLLNARGGEDRE